MTYVARLESPSDKAGSSDRAAITALLALVALLLGPLCFLGYGTWLNIYMMLSAGKSTWIAHVAETSRPPGYWTYEAVMFVTSQVGGYVLTNLVNLAVSLVDIFLVYTLALRWRAHYPLLCAAIVAVQPNFIIEATSSQDFNASMMFILLAVLALDQRRFWIGGVCLGIACLFRLSAVVPVGAIYAAFLLVSFEDRRVIQGLVLSGMVALALFAAACIPSYLVLGPTFYKGNLGPDEMWNVTTWIGRTVYKVLYFFGGPIVLVGGVALVASTFLVSRRKSPGPARPFSDPSSPREGRWLARHRETVLIWVCLAGCLALFAKFPVRQSYLLVALPFFALAVDRFAGTFGRVLSWLVVLALLSQNFILFNIAKPDIVGRATSGSPAFGVEPGYLLVDIPERLRFKNCDTLDCYKRLAGL